MTLSPTSSRFTQSAADALYLAKALADAKGDLLAATAADTFARLAVGSDGTFLKADSGQASGLAFAAAGSVVTLYDSTLGAAAANFDTDPTSLAGYKHLLVLVSLRMNTGTSALTVRLRMNNDSGANYDDHYLQVNNTTVTGARGASTSGIAAIVGGSADAAANYFASAQILIYDYLNTSRFKPVTFLTEAFSDTAADTFMRVGGGQYRSTSAVTRLQVLEGTVDMAAGSRMTVLGVG